MSTKQTAKVQQQQAALVAAVTSTDMLPTDESALTALRNRQQSWAKSAAAITDADAMLAHLERVSALLVPGDDIAAQVTALDERRRALTAALKVHTSFAVTVVRQGRRVGLTRDAIAAKVGLTPMQVGRIVSSFEVREAAKSVGLTLTSEQAMRLVNNPPKGAGGVSGIKRTIKTTGALPESPRPDREGKPETAKPGQVVSALSKALDLAKVAQVTADDKAAVDKARALAAEVTALLAEW